MRDGTTILTDPTPLAQDPYVVDWIDGRFVLVDGGQVIDQERAARRNAARHPTFTHLDRLARS
ncbi:MAG: hypothetical protein WCE44_04385 [Candidatus Velthaea sp.]